MRKLITELLFDIEDKNRKIFPIFFSSLFFTICVFTMYKSRIFLNPGGITDFSNHIISNAALANIDIVSRIHKYFIYIFVGPLSFIVIFTFLYYCLRKINFTKNAEETYSYISGISFFGIILSVSNLILNNNDYSSLFIAFILCISWTYLILSDKSYYVLLWSLLISIPISVYLNVIFVKKLVINNVQLLTNISNTNIIVFFVLWSFFSIISLFLFTKIISKSKNEVVSTRIAFCCIPILLTISIQSLALEFINIINKRFGIVSNTPFLIYSLIILLSFIIALVINYYMIKKNKGTCGFNSLSEIIGKIYIPILVISLALIIAQPYKFSIPWNEYFETANHGIALDHLFKYYSIPIVQNFDAHMLRNQIFPFIYSLINGYEPWGTVLYNPYAFIIFYITPIYIIARHFLGSIYSFLLFMFFPIMSFINPYYAIAAFMVFAVLKLLANRSWKNNYLFWIVSFLLMLYGVDIGFASVLSGICCYFIYSYILNQWTDIKKFFISGLSVYIGALCFFILLCVINQISPLLRIKEFIKLYVSNQNWAYSNVGDSSALPFVIGYYILPMAIIIMLSTMVVRILFKNKYGISSRILLNHNIFVIFMFFSLFFIFNVQRGIVRHNYYELNSISIVISTIPLALIAYFNIFDKSLYKFLLICLALIIVLQFGVSTTGDDPNNRSLISKSVTSLPYFEQYDSNKPYNETRVKGEIRNSEVIKFKKILDCILSKNETYFDFTSMNFYYALVDRKNPVYVNQSPLQLCDDFTQEMMLDQLKKADVPVAIVPTRKNSYSYLDEIAVDYKFYYVSEYLYKNYLPIIHLDNFDIYFRKDKYQGLVNKLKSSNIEKNDFVVDQKLIPEKWDRHLRSIPFLWGERDGVISKINVDKVRNVANVDDIIIEFDGVKKIASTLVMDLTSQKKSEAVLKIFSKRNSLSTYAFTIRKGTHRYAFRVSADYSFWNYDDLKYNLISNELISLTGIGMVQDLEKKPLTPLCRPVLKLADINDGVWNNGVSRHENQILLNYSSNKKSILSKDVQLVCDGSQGIRIESIISDEKYIILKVDKNLSLIKSKIMFPSNIELITTVR